MSSASSTTNDTILPQPLAPSDYSGHTLLFYEDDSALLDSLSQSICSAICSGNSAIVVATAAHHHGLATYLRERCANTHAAVIEGRLFLLDADEILSRIIVDGQLDPDRSMTVLGNYVASLLAAAHGENPHVLAFGELVALLWERGNQTAALHLELLCREFSEHPAVRLRCGYPLRLFPSDDASSGPVLGISSRQTWLLPSRDRESPTS